MSFECKVWQLIDPNPRSPIVLGDILAIPVADGFVSDPAKLRRDTPAMKLIGRQHGSGMYLRNGDSFEMKRVGWPVGG